MSSFKLLGFLATAAVLSLSAVACGGSSDAADNAGTPSDENDIKSGTCAPETTLTCAAGYEVTETGCASPRIAGGPTYGRCVKVDASGTCGPATTLTCASGYEITTVGCASPRIAGSPPYGRCVSVDAAKLTGTWLENLDSPPLGIDYEYTFASDGTFTARGGCRQDGPGVHCGAISQANGTWTITKSGPQLGAPGGAPEIVLVDEFNQKSTYFYSLNGKKLSLSKTYGVGATESVFVEQ